MGDWPQSKNCCWSTSVAFRVGGQSVSEDECEEAVKVVGTKAKADPIGEETNDMGTSHGYKLGRDRAMEE